MCVCRGRGVMGTGLTAAPAPGRKERSSLEGFLSLPLEGFRSQNAGLLLLCRVPGQSRQNLGSQGLRKAGRGSQPALGGCRSSRGPGPASGADGESQVVFKWHLTQPAALPAGQGGADKCYFGTEGKRGRRLR